MEIQAGQIVKTRRHPHLTYVLAPVEHEDRYDWRCDDGWVHDPDNLGPATDAEIAAYRQVMQQRQAALDKAIAAGLFD